MRITALYDQDGVIIAAAPATGKYDDPVPVASAGTTAATFDVPSDVAELGLEEICTGHRVDVARQRLVRDN